MPANGVRRRTLALAIAGALVVLAVALVMFGPAPAGGPPVPAPSGSSAAPPSPQPTRSPSASTDAAPATTPAETDTPEAGETPVEPPATVAPAEPGPSDAPEEPAVPPTPQPPAFPEPLLGQDLTVVPGAGRTVALTFDAGANAAGLPKILSTLAAKGVAGTFFLTGSWAANNPQGVAQIAAAGHRVANHSMTHPGFTGLADDAIINEVRSAEQAILAAGADPRPLFRFPYGERDARTIAAVNALGYVAVRWTVDTLGWKGTSGGASVQSVADRVHAGLQPGEIVLMHIGSNPDDGTTLDADALPQVIDRIRAAGYGFVTLDALLGRWPPAGTGLMALPAVTAQSNTGREGSRLAAAFSESEVGGSVRLERRHGPVGLCTDEHQHGGGLGSGHHRHCPAGPLPAGPLPAQPAASVSAAGGGPARGAFRPRGDRRCGVPEQAGRPARPPGHLSQCLRQETDTGSP
ncbi:polysaccharide deacetylase family protein [Pseudarthrobacter sp. NPDC058196]|uniref:polysaccharide deacetylase family protein n=1 Tax=Pseudarthrobacter sp. NPDC058196 TaxID=3346376 RepID=UPI0036DC044A